MYNWSEAEPTIIHIETMHNKHIRIEKDYLFFNV
jgi:hypothetical protein